MRQRQALLSLDKRAIWQYCPAVDEEVKHPNEGARLVRQEMKRRGWKQKQLAEFLDEDESQISRILNEQRLPNIGLGVRIRDRLGIDPAMFTRPPAPEAKGAA